MVGTQASLILAFFLVVPEIYAAKLKVVTTTTDLAWAAREIGGEYVEVESLLNGSEDPHFAEAVPKYIRTVANADILCSIGLGLEIGWLPKVLAKAGNAKVQQGGLGHCVTSSMVPVLDKVSGAVDRSMGDVHPEGNPHFWLGVSSFIAGSQVIKQVFQAHNPDKKEAYEQAYQVWKGKFESVFQENKNKLKGISSQKSLKIMPYHSEFIYFFRDYEIPFTEAMEEKPGVAPSAGRLAKAVALAKTQKVNLVLASETHPREILKKFEELSGIPVAIVPVTVKPGSPHADGFALQKIIVSKIQDTLK